MPGAAGATRGAFLHGNRPLKSVAVLDADSLLEMSETSYIELVQWKGEQTRTDAGARRPVLLSDWLAPQTGPRWRSP